MSKSKILTMLVAACALVLTSAVTPAAARWGGGWHGGGWRGAGIAAGIGAVECKPAGNRCHLKSASNSAAGWAAGRAVASLIRQRRRSRRNDHEPLPVAPFDATAVEAAAATAAEAVTHHRLPAMLWSKALIRRWLLDRNGA